MSELDSRETEAIEAELEEDKKIEDSDPSENEIKAADRQKTLESIDFYNRTSRQGKYAFGYSSDLIKARRAARAEIQKQFYTGDQGTFEQYEASRVSSDIQSLHNAEAHERTQLIRYRQEADKAELISAKEKLSDSVTGRIGAVADASVANIAIANKVVEDSMKAVKSAESNLAAAEEALKDAAKNGDIVDPGVIDAYKNTLESANKTLKKALAIQAAASVDQDSSLSKEFTAAYAQISDESKKWFARRYNELLQYGYNEDMAYVIASSDASNLSMGAIEDLIANGNREAADSILDMMGGVKPKLNSETGEYEIDRSKRGYMSAGDIYKLKDAIKAQRNQEAAEAKAQAKATNDALKVEANNIKMMATMDKIKDMETAYALVKALGDKGYVNTSEVLDHCKNVIDSRAKAKEAAVKAAAKAANDRDKELSEKVNQRVKENIDAMSAKIDRVTTVDSLVEGKPSSATVDMLTYTKEYINEAFTYGMITADERAYYSKNIDVEYATRWASTVQDALRDAGVMVKHPTENVGSANRTTKMKSLPNKDTWFQTDLDEYTEKGGDVLLSVTDKGEFDVSGDTAQSEFSIRAADPSDPNRTIVITFGQAQMEQIIDSAWTAHKLSPTLGADGKPKIPFKENIIAAINSETRKAIDNKTANDIMNNFVKAMKGEKIVKDDKLIDVNRQKQERASAVIKKSVRETFKKMQSAIYAEKGE
jgi:hypothetical protein